MNCNAFHARLAQAARLGALLSVCLAIHVSVSSAKLTAAKQKRPFTQHSRPTSQSLSNSSIPNNGFGWNFGTPNEECKPTEVGFVCTCSSKGQDCTLRPIEWPTKSGSAIIVTTSRQGDVFEVRQLNATKHTGTRVDGVSRIQVNLAHRKQPIIGWGGAITDSASLNILSLSSDMSDKLLESYFGETGLQYNMARTTIAGSDFSTRAYSYDDTDEPDYDLKHWSLQEEDTKLKIPIITKSLALARERGVQLKLFASPWSPPKWMKDNKNFVRGHLINDVKTYQSYANYLKKFFVAYKEHNITFWGATIQNEPQIANWEGYFLSSLQMSPEEATKFLTKFYGPALEAIGLTKDNFKIMVGDDSLGFVDDTVRSMLHNEEVKKYATAFAIHWYTSSTDESYDKLTKLYEDVKDEMEFALMTEACNGQKPEKSVVLGSWERAERYARDIIQDLNRHIGGWIDWNLALDQQGGPSFPNNFVDSPIIVDAKNDLFYKQPMYYALGHFSRFFKPNSRIVLTKLTGHAPSSQSNLFVVAAQNDGHLIVNVLNLDSSSREAKLIIDGNQFLVDLKPHSLQSIIAKL